MRDEGGRGEGKGEGGKRGGRGEGGRSEGRGRREYLSKPPARRMEETT